MTSLDDFIPLSRPMFGPEEASAVAQCLSSGWISAGPKVAEFELAFATLAGCKEAVATSSGTSALHLSLWSLDLSPGDEVITPSLTWVSAPNVIRLLGLRPVFCDVNPATLCMDVEHLSTLITARTRVILPVHFGGRAAELDAINEIATRHGIIVIEDAAHAIGAWYNGYPIGSHSDLVTFSFHPNKNITTCEGGMITGRNLSLLSKARQRRYHGINRDSFKRHTSAGHAAYYDVLDPGLKYILTDPMAAIGLCQLDKLNWFNARRHEIAMTYCERLQDIPIGLPSPEHRENSVHAWHLFPVTTPDINGLRDSIMTALAEKRVGTGLHYTPVHDMSWVHKAGLYRALPTTERIGRTILSLPLYPGLTDNQLEAVCSRFKEIVTALI